MKIVKLEEVEGMTFPTGRRTRVLTGQDLLPTKNFTTGYVVIEPKGKIPQHKHSNEEIYIFLKGNGKMVVGPEEKMVEAVSAVYIEPNVEHFLQNIGEEEMITLLSKISPNSMIAP